jgi:hypothetical protein
MKTMERFSNGWLTIRMLGIWSGVAPDYDKVRWALPGGGKSGGIRVLYYWRANADQIYLLFLFGKGERSDLTPVQVRELAKYVKELK